VPKASAVIGISAGQARLRDISIRADGADLQATVNVDLADAMVDALLTLNALPQSAGAVQPAVMVALKGPLPAPRRSIDTSLMNSWLTLRNVEQQSRQLDAMERAAREAAAAAAAAQSPAKPKESDQAPPAAASPTPEPAPAAPAPNATNGMSGELGAPVLPPPVTIPAAPKPRVAPRTDGAAPPRPSARPNPAGPGLLGPQN